MPAPADTDGTADGDPRPLSDYVFTAAGLLPVGAAVGAVLSAFFPGWVALVGGATTWGLMVHRVVGLGEDRNRAATRHQSVRSNPGEAASKLDGATAEVDALEAETRADRLPVARGVIDRAGRYLDHDAPARAASAADRARRVAKGEVAVRSTLEDARPVRRHVDAVGRIEDLLGNAEAVASTDPERAEELVEEARGVADRLGGQLRSAAADRAEDARRADPDRARRLWSEAYELADAAAEIGLGGGSGRSPEAAGRSPDAATGDDHSADGSGGPDDPREKGDDRSAGERARGETGTEF